ncbi:RcpC/CpaB family pilus assembly protein [Streptomyces sp. NPDC051907]|uniref:RcpC/CpaB family pilus assembly protein n=1 Tax=Streptomyces sp. NPDC051907 TaxID=3155284 RepID=UPI00342444AC
MPEFAPLRVRGGAHRLRRAMRRRRRALAAGLAMTAAALAASGAHGDDGVRAGAPATDPQRERPTAAEMVSAPVRIADAATVRLLRPGDRVDVIATPNSPAGEGASARVVASGVRVSNVPRNVPRADAGDVPREDPHKDPSEGPSDDPREVPYEVAEMNGASREASDPEGGALVVLSVPRSTAAALAGAGATSRLAVTVC